VSSCSAVVPYQAHVSFFGGDLIHWFQFHLQGDLKKIAEIKWPEF
jgi:hypothetical protein